MTSFHHSLPSGLSIAPQGSTYTSTNSDDAKIDFRERRRQSLSQSGEKPLGSYKITRLSCVEMNIQDGTAFLDVGSWPLEWLLAPEAYLPQDLARLINSVMDETARDLAREIKTQLSASNTQLLTDDTIEKIAKYQSDVRQQISALCELGKLVNEEFVKRTGNEFPAELVSEKVSAYSYLCPIDELIQEEGLDETLACHVANGQRNTLPVRNKAGDKVCSVKKQSVIRPALDRLANNQITLSKAPVYSNFVPAPIARCFAASMGFMDSLSSLNLRHGKSSHAVQLGALFFMRLLKSNDELDFLISHGAWEMLLDSIPSAHMDYVSVEGGKGIRASLGDAQENSSRLMLLQFMRRISGNTPLTLHMMLVTGEFSSALSCLNRDGYLSEAMKTLNITSTDSETDQRLVCKAIHHCRVLETYVSDSYFKEVDKILQALPDCSTEKDLYERVNVRRGHFFSSPDNKTTALAKLRRAINVGKPVYVICKSIIGRYYLERADRERHWNHTGGFILLKNESGQLPDAIRTYERTVQEVPCCCRTM